MPFNPSIHTNNKSSCLHTAYIFYDIFNNSSFHTWPTTAKRIYDVCVVSHWFHNKINFIVFTITEISLFSQQKKSHCFHNNRNQHQLLNSFQPVLRCKSYSQDDQPVVRWVHPFIFCLMELHCNGWDNSISQWIFTKIDIDKEIFIKIDFDKDIYKNIYIDKEIFKRLILTRRFSKYLHLQGDFRNNDFDKKILGRLFWQGDFQKYLHRQGHWHWQGNWDFNFGPQWKRWITPSCNPVQRMKIVHFARW